MEVGPLFDEYFLNIDNPPYVFFPPYHGELVGLRVLVLDVDVSLEDIAIVFYPSLEEKRPLEARLGEGLVRVEGAEAVPGKH